MAKTTMVIVYNVSYSALCGRKWKQKVEGEWVMCQMLTTNQPLCSICFIYIKGL